jgi:hypothetical protein
MLSKKNDYRVFVQNLILKNVKDNFFFYKESKINLKPIQYRLDYVSLLNDEEFFYFYNNIDKKNFFYFSSIISFKYAKLLKKKNIIIKLNFNLRLVFNYIKNTELFYNLYFFLINFFFSPKKNKEIFLCFVHKKKLFNYIYFLLKKIKYKCIFIVLSKKQQKELKLDDGNSIVLPSINLSETSFFINQNANNVPYGLSVEIFKLKILRNLKKNSWLDKEHVTINFPKRHNVFNNNLNINFNKKNHKCSVDTIEDYFLIKNFFEKCVNSINLDWEKLI